MQQAPGDLGRPAPVTVNFLGPPRAGVVVGVAREAFSRDFSPGEKWGQMYPVRGLAQHKLRQNVKKWEEIASLASQSTPILTGKSRSRRPIPIGIQRVAS